MKIAIGISGGVDSAVAALLLKERGHDLCGVVMTLGRADEAKSLAEAKAAAKRLDLPLEVFDFSKEWQTSIAGSIKTEYLSGRTPNPCVRCNELIKLGLLPRLAFERLGCEGFATGHYARKEIKDGKTFLKRAVDLKKDQSYFLYRVHPEILERLHFPLGELTKGEVREIARSRGLVVADKGDSQDFCGGDVRSYISAADREGNIITTAGKVLGKHRGYWNYTVGMRKGLGIGGGTPYYVLALRPETNEVVVGFKEAAIVKELKLRDTVGRIDFSLPVKVRSTGEMRYLADGIAGVAPGQSAVFYDGEEVVGGGIII